MSRSNGARGRSTLRGAVGTTIKTRLADHPTDGNCCGFAGVALSTAQSKPGVNQIRALLVGIDGLIGQALARALTKQGSDVVGTSRRSAPSGGYRTIRLDLAEVPGPAALSALPDCDVICICAAMTSFAECRAAPDVARRVNLEAPAVLATHFVGRGAHVIYLSTAAVLDCLVPWMRADRPRAGRSLYGRLKGEAEEAVLSLGARVTVLRLAKVLTADAPLLPRWIAALQAGSTIEAFDDHRIAPVTVGHAVDALAILVAQSEGGIYQLSGACDVSYAEIAADLTAALGYPATRVRRCRATDRGIPPDDLTPYTSLDCARLTALTSVTPPEPFALIRKLHLALSAVERS